VIFVTRHLGLHGESTGSGVPQWGWKGNAPFPRRGRFALSVFGADTWRTPSASEPRARGFLTKPSMRLFWSALVIAALVALDRAYMNGQNAAFFASIAGEAAKSINDWASHLVRWMRP
jgi:hypothetical protein